MIARLRVHGQETWHRNVVSAEGVDGYLRLGLESRPHRVYYWLGNGHTSVLLCATGADVTAALREEKGQLTPDEARKHFYPDPMEDR